MVSSDSPNTRKRTFAEFMALVVATPSYVDPPEHRHGAATVAAAPVGEGGGRGEQAANPTGASGKSDRVADLPASSPSILDPITNFDIDFDNGKPKVVPLPLTEILNRIQTASGDWPRKHAGQLFVHKPGSQMHTIVNTPDFFSWLHESFGNVEFRKLSGCPTKEETFHGMKRRATEYVAIEKLPHYPQINGHYYMCEDYPQSDGKVLREFLELFHPATDLDRFLILAMFATVFWGGGGGQRPAFVIDSDSGRGAGKTKMTDILSRLGGDMIDFNPHDSPEVIRQRLLSAEGRKARIARIDNVKSHRFSWSELESLITAHSISGKQLHVGEGTRPNTLTWVITLNQASLSTDMAQRSVIIKILAPKRSGKWEKRASEFIEKNRDAIISDLLTVLRLPVVDLPKYSRWASWEENVLSKLPDAERLQELIAKRAAEADVERDEIEAIEELFFDKLSELEYEPDNEKIHIPPKISAAWYSEAVTDKKMSNPSAVGRTLKQFVREGRTTYLQVNPSHKHGRGLLWVGRECSEDDKVDYTIESRYSSQSKWKKY